MNQKKIDRRQFLRNISLSVAGAGFMLKTLDVASARAAASGVQNSSTPAMEYRDLGKTGMKVSAVSFGVMSLTDPAVLFKALDVGINYFDTAWMYQNGKNEELLGKVLKEYGRKKVFIATKIAPVFSFRAKDSMPMEKPEKMEEKMGQSLKRLQTDYVDVLFLHNVVKPEWATHEPMLKFLEKMKQQGKARFVGISFHEGSTLTRVTQAGLQTNFYDVFLAALNFKSPPEHAEALKKARQKGIGIIAMKTQAGGYQNVQHGSLSPFQAALAWALQNDFVDCAIPGMVNLEQVVENAGAVGKKLGWSERKTLHAYYGSIKDRYCLRCGQCSGTCPNETAIPTVNRALMYYEGYRDRELARSTYRNLGSVENARGCATCRDLTCSCVNGINIAERMRYAHALLA
jgi:predicted aldo/keto reductase-like oxidoreductase